MGLMAGGGRNDDSARGIHREAAPAEGGYGLVAWAAAALPVDAAELEASGLVLDAMPSSPPAGTPPVVGPRVSDGGLAGGTGGWGQGFAAAGVAVGAGEPLA